MCDTFKRVIVILVMRHISAVIFDVGSSLFSSKLYAELCQFTRIPMTRLNVSSISMLLNICQCYMFENLRSLSQ